MMALPIRVSSRVSLSPVTRGTVRSLSSTVARNNESYRFVVAGGGAGGLAIASSLARKHGEGSVAVIEPSQVMVVNCMDPVIKTPLIWVNQ